MKSKDYDSFTIDEDAVVNNFGAIGCEDDITQLKNFFSDNKIECQIEEVINGYELVRRGYLDKNEILIDAIEKFPNLSIYIYAVSSMKWWRYLSESGKSYISKLCAWGWHEREDEGVWTEDFNVIKYAPEVYSLKGKKMKKAEIQAENCEDVILSVKAAKEQWRFKEENGEYIITGYRGTEHNITIPKMIGKKTVVGLENGIRDKEDFWMADIGKIAIMQVNIPNSVKYIDGTIFENCVNLVKLNLPDNSRCMGTADFRGCKNLSDLKIPSNCKIGGILLDEECELANPVFYSEDGTVALCADYLAETIILNKNTKRVLSYAFGECEYLCSIELPEGLEIIEDNAFFYCTSLVELKLPASVKNVGSAIAEECKNLQRIVLEGDVKVDDSFVVPKGTYSREDEMFEKFVEDSEDRW